MHQFPRAAASGPGFGHIVALNLAASGPGLDVMAVSSTVVGSRLDHLASDPD